MKFRAFIASAGAVLALAGPAWAQFGGGSVWVAGGRIFVDGGYNLKVNDLPEEERTQQVINALTIGGGSGDYSPINGYMSDRHAELFSAIRNDSAFAELYPGWKPLGPNSTFDAKAIATQTLHTYGEAFRSAQLQSQELTTENFSGIESKSASASNVLIAIQANTEAQLAVAQQLQYVRQLLIAQIATETAHHGEELNEKTQNIATKAAPTTAHSWLYGR